MLPGVIALGIGWLFLRMVPPATLGGVWPPLLLAVLGSGWMVANALGNRRDTFLPAIALVIMAIGLVVIGRISAEEAQRQEVWIALALTAGGILANPFARFRALAGYRYIWVLGSICLFFAVMLFGTEVNGAKLWIRVGPFLQIEPIEIIKLCIVFFMAAYLAETADVIAASRWWSLRANARHLGPLVLGFGASMSILVLQRDLGMAILLLAIFVVMLYVATRRLDLIVGACCIFGVLVLWAAHHYPYVADRLSVWQNPYRDPLGSGYQALQARYAVAAGGIAGTGYRLGQPSYIPEAATDYVWAVWSEEFGFGGAIALLTLYAALVIRMLDAGRRAPDLYAKLLATGLSTTLGVQVIIITGGVLGVMPLTGITLPFISYGGSSLVANVLLVALVTAISQDRAAAAPAAPGPFIPFQRADSQRRVDS